MESILFLLGALVLVGLGTAVIALRAHEPRGLDHSVKEFRREMQALSPDTRKGDEIEPIDPLTMRGAEQPSDGE
jgi:hypothetical protein